MDYYTDFDRAAELSSGLSDKAAAAAIAEAELEPCSCCNCTSENALDLYDVVRYPEYGDDEGEIHAINGHKCEVFWPRRGVKEPRAEWVASCKLEFIRKPRDSYEWIDEYWF
jgi:hypothetical protein